MSKELIYGDISYKINGILFNVHNELGRYCNEKQYSDAIEKKLAESGLVYEREKILPPSFDGEAKGRNRIDFLIQNKIILEIKAKNIVGREDYYQSRRYLGALKVKLALIVNFRSKELRIKRILNSSVNE
jgi:GxxExxY protein